VNRDTESMLLVLLGGAVLRISADNTFLRYVKGWTRPYLLAAGATLVVLGLASLWREHISGRSRRLRAQTPDVPPVAAGAGPPVPDDGHGHDGQIGPPVAWLLLLPVFAIFLVAPPALGSYAAARGSNNVVQPAQSEFAPLADGDPVTVTLTDYATRAIWDQGRSLQGRRVRMVGFVSSRPGGGAYLTRLVITCCAADARPIKITVQGGSDAQGLAVDSWIEVVGSYGGLDAAAGKSGQVPVIKADSVRRVPAPSEPYES
jgi:uncharacterized repeat protein (TIGR03943 family)